MIKKGFSGNQACDGVTYLYHPYDDLTFMCNLQERTIVAEFPDFIYNARNRFSPKNKIIDYSWKDQTDINVIEHNYDILHDKVMMEYNNKI